MGIWGKWRIFYSAYSALFRQLLGIEQVFYWFRFPSLVKQFLFYQFGQIRSFCSVLSIFTSETSEIIRKFIGNIDNLSEVEFFWTSSVLWRYNFCNFGQQRKTTSQQCKCSLFARNARFLPTIQDNVNVPEAIMRQYSSHLNLKTVVYRIFEYPPFIRHIRHLPAIYESYPPTLIT